MGADQRSLSTAEMIRILVDGAPPFDEDTERRLRRLIQQARDERAGVGAAESVQVQPSKAA